MRMLEYLQRIGQDLCTSSFRNHAKQDLPGSALQSHALSARAGLHVRHWPLQRQLHAGGRLSSPCDSCAIAYLIADSGGAFLTYSSQIASRCWQSIDIDVTNADSQCDLPYCMIMRASNVLVAKTLQLNTFACTCTMEHASVEFFYSLVTLVRRAVTLLVVRGCAS